MGNGDIHQKLHGLFLGRDFDAMDDYLDAKFTYEDVPRGLAMHTLGEFKGWLQGWLTGFSDSRIEEAQYLDGPDFSVCMFQGRGRNDGPLGDLPPTGRTTDRIVLRGNAIRIGWQGRLLPDLLRPVVAPEPAGPYHPTRMRMWM
ncbi:hypothetical protein [Rhodococcus sp. NPDC003348]